MTKKTSLFEVFLLGLLFEISDSNKTKLLI